MSDWEMVRNAAPNSYMKMPITLFIAKKKNQSNNPVKQKFKNCLTYGSENGLSEVEYQQL